MELCWTLCVYILHSRLAAGKCHKVSCSLPVMQYHYVLRIIVMTVHAHMINHKLQKATSDYR